ncbi:MAG TPA: tetratricopeptide repeat protein [Gemmatimonadaceae bacterium]|nr:tetratricopeptide repeat protein [Gemmatimonadaceae bacterium]
MKAGIRQARIMGGLLLAAAVATMPASLQAQQRRVIAPKEGVPRFMVLTLRSDEKGLGAQAADAIRSKLQSDFSTNDLWVISKENIAATLEASGFPKDEAPDRVTSRLLAQNLRADEYLEGRVTKKPDGTVHVEAGMVLTRDNSMVQPLPPAEGKMGDVASQISRSFKEARKQLPDERKCENAIRDQKYDEAIAAANAAIAAYPRSTISRVCLANALVYKKAPADSVIAVTKQVLEIDPRNRPALSIAAQAYTDANRDQEAVDAWTRRLALDPSDARLQQKVAQILAQSGNAAAALPIIDTAVAQNPGDPELTRLQFLVRLTVAGKTGEGWKKVIESGEALQKADTAYADTLFFARLATAYAADSQPQKAAETTARGVAKFPQNATLLAMHARMLKAAGQTQQSVEAARRALALDPKNFAGWLSLADAQAELNQPDSAVATLREALKYAGDDGKPQVGQRLLILGNAAYKQGVASKSRADFERAVSILALGDSVATSENTKFLLGVSAFQVGDALVRENQKARSCEDARKAKEMFGIAQINVPAGGKVSPQAAGQIMGALGQYAPAVESQIKAFCK